MIFRLGYASNQNYSHAYWFNNDPKTCYEVKTGIYNGPLNFDKEAQYWDIYIKKGNKPYSKISLDQLKNYIK